MSLEENYAMEKELDEREKINKKHVATLMELAEAEDEEQRKQFTNTRTFKSGATRDTDKGKLDYDGFLSPLVLKRYAEYMHKCRVQSDGKVRDSDNWKKGIPSSVYMKSMWRHFMDVWSWNFKKGRLENISYNEIKEQEDSLCAVIFNASGYLHELLKVNLMHKDQGLELKKNKILGRRLGPLGIYEEWVNGSWRTSKDQECTNIWNVNSKPIEECPSYISPPREQALALMELARERAKYIRFPTVTPSGEAFKCK
jgi:hypothetical protein